MIPYTYAQVQYTYAQVQYHKSGHGLGPESNHTLVGISWLNSVLFVLARACTIKHYGFVIYEDELISL